MQIKRKWQLTAVTALTVAGLAFSVAPAAQADPPNTVNPVIDGFGSDTTQDVLNGLAETVTNGGTRIIASYNAGTGLLTAVTTPRRPGEVTPVDVPRANGSGQGKTLLRAGITGGTPVLNGATASGPLARDDAEFSRSSSEGTWDPAGDLNYLPFAVDAVSYAKYNTTPGTVIPGNLPLGASVNEKWTSGTNSGQLKLTLRNIYGNIGITGTGTAKLYSAASGGSLFTVGSQASAAQIVPFIPQPGSGTRQFWQDTLVGVGASYGTHVSAKWTDGSGTHDVQEHDGSVLAALPTRAIVPFSIAQHIAQNRAATLSTKYGVTVPVRLHGAALGTINGVAATDANGNLNSGFPVKRAVFNVVEHDTITSGSGVYNSTLDGLFDSNIVLGADLPGDKLDGGNPVLSGGNVQYNSRARVVTATNGGASVITDFGFGAIPTNGVTINSPSNGGANFTYLQGDTRYRSN